MPPRTHHSRIESWGGVQLVGAASLPLPPRLKASAIDNIACSRGVREDTPQEHGRSGSDVFGRGSPKLDGHVASRTVRQRRAKRTRARGAGAGTCSALSGAGKGSALGGAVGTRNTKLSVSTYLGGDRCAPLWHTRGPWTGTRPAPVLRAELAELGPVGGAAQIGGRSRGIPRPGCPAALGGRAITALAGAAWRPSRGLPPRVRSGPGGRGRARGARGPGGCGRDVSSLVQPPRRGRGRPGPVVGLDSRRRRRGSRRRPKILSEDHGHRDVPAAAELRAGGRAGVPGWRGGARVIPLG